MILLSFLVSFVAKEIDQVLKMRIGMGNYSGNEFALRPKAHIWGKMFRVFYVPFNFTCSFPFSNSSLLKLSINFSKFEISKHKKHWSLLFIHKKQSSLSLPFQKTKTKKASK